MGWDSAEETLLGMSWTLWMSSPILGPSALHGLLPIPAKPTLNKALNEPKGAVCAWAQHRFWNNTNPGILGLNINGTHEDY